MLRRWRRRTSRRRARLNSKQQPMTPSSSPVHELSNQEDCPDSTTKITEHDHPQQPDRDDETQRRSIDDQVAHTVAELEGLSLSVDTFTRGKNEVVSDEGDKETDDNSGSPALPFDDPEEGSQTSSEESCPSSGSSSTTDGHSSAGEDEEEPTSLDEEDGPLPSPETTFKFHEEFSSHGNINDNYGLEPLPPPPPLEEEDEEAEEFAMEEDVEEDPPYSPPGLWSSSAVPKWAFLRSSNSLPMLGLGPGDFFHGGSALRHEVSADEDEDEVEDEEEDDDEEDEEAEGSDSDDDVEDKASYDIAAVSVVHL